MKSARTLCAILFLATGLAAQTSTPPKPRKPKPATVTAADVQALKDAIASQQAALAQQQQQIQELQNQLRTKDQASQQAQSAATEAATKAEAAQAQSAQQQPADKAGDEPAAAHRLRRGKTGRRQRDDRDFHPVLADPAAPLCKLQHPCG